MYCIECGAENLERAKFCIECGAKVPTPDERAAAAAAEPIIEEQKVEEPPAPPEEQQEEVEEEEEGAETSEEESAPAEEAPPEPEIATLQAAAEEEEPGDEEPGDEEAGEGQGGAEEEKEEDKQEEEPGEALTMAPTAIAVGVPVAAAPPEVPMGIPVDASPEPEEKAEDSEEEAGEEKAAEADATQPTLAQAKVEADVTQPTLPQMPSAAPPAAPAAPPPWPPEQPRGMKTLGVLCIISGLLSSLINVIAPLIAMGTIWNKRGVEIALVAIPTVAVIWLGYSMLLFVGGVGLVRGRLWGRKLCLAFAWTGVLLMLYSVIGLSVAEAIMHARGGVQQSFNVLVAAGLFFPALTVVLLMGLLTGRIKRWAEFMEAGPGIIPPARPEPSMPAVFCLLTSLMPVPVLAHTYSLILGFVGLRQIARSGGRKCGRGKAIAGMVISGLVLLTVLAGIGLAIGIAAAKGS